MKDGHKVFGYGTGAYTPVISDGHRIYLTGYSSITALEPLTRKQIEGRAKARREKAARKKSRQQARSAAKKPHKAANGRKSP